MAVDPFAGLGLRPISLADRAEFERRFSTLRAPLSDYTFSQLFTWSNSLRILWKQIRGHLCVFANGTGDLTLLMPPIGDGGADADAALREAFEVMDTYNAAHGVPDRSRVEYASDELLARLDQSKLALEPMGGDYVYETARMIDLTGGALASKRQLKTRFARLYDYRVEPYDAARHLAPCRQLLKLWKQTQDAQHGDATTTGALKRQKETTACALALEHAEALGLRGMVVYVRSRDQGVPEADRSLRGFTFGEHLGQDQSSIVIEKTDLGVRGLAQFIFSEFCRTDWADRPLVNAGDDWGLESLAWTKQSYRPVTMLQKYAFRMAARAMASVPSVANPDIFEPIIRRARTTDLSAAVALEQACFSSHQLTRRQLQYLQHRPSAIFLVADCAGSLAGQVIGLIRHHRRGLSGRIYSLAVATGHRRRKLGLKLLRAMVEELTSRGVRRIYLEVEHDNAPALALYAREGFRAIGTLPDYYAPGSDGTHMMLELPATITCATSPVAA